MHAMRKCSVKPQGFVDFFPSLRGGSIPTLHLKILNSFFLGPDFWKIHQSNVGLTASTSHDGSSMHRDIFLKSWSEKNVLKAVDSLTLSVLHMRVIMAVLHR